MADDLDRFTLMYKVELSDSISRLEKLQQKMDGVQKGTKGGADGFKHFASGAASELSKLTPELEAVGGAVRALGAEFALAGAAVAVLAMGVKAVMNLRQQYNAQRSEGMLMGVSGTRLEEYQRKFAKGSGGMVSRDAALEGIKTFSGMSNSAYQDPSRLGREARIMRMLGVNVGERGHTPTGLNTELVQLASGLQGKSTADVQGIAKATGMSQDWLLTVQKLGPSIGKVTEMTGAEIEKRREAEDSLAKFNDELNKFKESINELEMKVGQGVLPAMEKFISFLSKIVDLANRMTAPSEQKPQNDPSVKGRFGPGHVWIPNPNYVDPNAPSSGKGHFGPGHAWIPDRAHAAAKAEEDQAKQKEQDKRTQAVEKMDEANKQGIQTANQMSLAINMFAGAVQSFSSAIDIHQAWAAWAGEIGAKGGMPGSSGAAIPVGSTKYDAAFDAAAKKYNVPVDMLKRIAQVESTMNQNAVSPTGAGGLMQITRGNQKAYGLADYRDPASNIMVGARIYRENLDRHHGDVAAALRGYNGNSDPNYVSKVLGSGIGESRSKMNVRSVQQSIADYLHVPLQQIQTGGVTTGDAGWAASQAQAGIQNHIYDIQRQLSVAGMPAQNYARLKMEFRDSSRGLDLMRQYSADVVGRQQPGGQQLTIGERAIVINVNGAQDPKAVSDEVNNQITKHMNDLLNHFSDGHKG